MIAAIIEEWRARAEMFRDHAQDPVAITYERCAERLEALLEEEASTPLTLGQAAMIGGYSEDHLGRMVREERISNVGRKGAPRIRRADVPIKSGYVAPTSANPELRMEQIVRSVIDEGVG